MSSSTPREVVVVGAGPGGYYAALRLAQRGFQVTVVEREAVGGVCLNWGCIPSKALITAAERYHQTFHSEMMGLTVQGAQFSLERAQEWTAGIVRHHVGGVESLLREEKIELVRGTARVAGPDEVHVESANGERRTLRPSHGVVIATGAHPTTPPGVQLDGERVLSAKEAIRLRQVPQSLAVLGGGVIGLELGGVYARIGSRVTVIEASDHLLGTVDPDLVRIVERSLGKEGIVVRKSTRATRVTVNADGVELELTNADGSTSERFERVLVATGFAPNTDGLFLPNAGVTLDARGHVVIDRACRTNVPGIYAIGDVSGAPYLAHKAFKEAEVVAEVIEGKKTELDYLALPSAIFTTPEIAVSGLSEAEARARHPDVQVARFPLAALGRSQTVGGSDGFVKVIATKGRLLGVGAVGPHVSELLGEASLALETRATLEDLALTIHPHPTFSEAVREAAEVALGQAIHVRNQKPRATTPARGAA